MPDRDENRLSDYLTLKHSFSQKVELVRGLEKPPYDNNTSNKSGIPDFEIMSGTLNFNIGVLGHVDSGKTSLCKALSTTASTAAFDKNPQSKERGITLDLGFSSFTMPLPEARKGEFLGSGSVQYTLVDCPGHASLIRTIIGGKQARTFSVRKPHSI